MGLAPGDTLGSYEVIGLLGKGGMGEVYRARDLTLKREVALKVLPASFLIDGDRLARFQREAQVLASLEHPNIGHIYGVIDAADSRALVLALIEGSTLADRIQAGPIPIAETVAIAKQMIEALEYAHERGVVHRDLKPANVKITPDGVVKILDFGLAKVLEDEPAYSGSLENSPTLTLGHTRAGMILGTAAYMSPEQAVGRPVDRRSDIFSFGVVLYEMLTGKQAFGGATMPDVLEAVVKNDPDWSALPAATTVHLRKLLERLLVKDRKQRLQAIGEARILLNAPPESPIVVQSPHKASKLPWIAAAVFAIAAVGLGWVAFRHTSEEPPRMVRLSVDLPPGVEAQFQNSPPAVSPDGKMIVFAAKKDDRTQFWIRNLDSLNLRPVEGTDNAIFPFWSPDSGWIGFFADNKLKKIEASGGTPISLASAADSARGGTWASNGSIYYAPNSRSVIYRVPASGGEAKPVTKFEGEEATHRFPWLLPDGEHLFYSVGGTTSGRQSYWADLNSGQRLPTLKSDGSIRYAAGHLLFHSEGSLFAQPFDPKAGKLTGEARPIAENVAAIPGNGQIQLGVAQDAGVLAYVQSGGFENQFTWMDRSGRITGTEGKAAIHSQPMLSPDNGAIAYGVAADEIGKTQDLWIQNRRTQSPQRFTLGGKSALPVWSPDGSKIAYSDFTSRPTRILMKSSNGVGQFEVIDDTPDESNSNKLVRDWSRDGRYLIIETEQNPKTQNDIWYIDLKGDKKRVPFLNANYAERAPVLSPNGRWLAYESTDSGVSQIIVQSFPDGKTKLQVSSEPSVRPHWSPDGKELYFLNPGLKMVATKVKGAALGDNGSFDAGPLAELFDAPSPNFDVGKDGRFLFLRPVAQESAGRLHVILNWDAGLKKQ